MLRIQFEILNKNELVRWTEGLIWSGAMIPLSLVEELVKRYKSESSTEFSYTDPRQLPLFD